VPVKKFWLKYDGPTVLCALDATRKMRVLLQLEKNISALNAGIKFR